LLDLEPHSVKHVGDPLWQLIEGGFKSTWLAKATGPENVWPDLSLSDALLKRGERDAVAEYLQNCSRFWQGRSKVLEDWIAQIRSGKSPRLNRFMARRSSSQDG
jgi:hypothetical protein